MNKIKRKKDSFVIISDHVVGAYRRENLNTEPWTCKKKATVWLIFSLLGFGYPCTQFTLEQGVHFMKRVVFNSKGWIGNWKREFIILSVNATSSVFHKSRRSSPDFRCTEGSIPAPLLQNIDFFDVSMNIVPAEDFFEKFLPLPTVGKEHLKRHHPGFVVARRKSQTV